MIRWGILGAGNIAHRFSDSLKFQKDSVLTAIAVRNPEKGEKFAQQYNVEKVYLNYQQLLDDPDVDVIYLALPHGLHCEWAVKALQNKKAVLCEKPAVICEEEMLKIRQAAIENNILFMEAMKPRFVPLYNEIKKTVEEMGPITKVRVTLCNDMRGLPRGVTYHTDPGQGGSILDSGTYCVSWLEDFLSGEADLRYIRGNYWGGIDYYVLAELDFDGVKVTYETGFDRRKNRECIIETDKGTISISELHRPVKMVINRNGEEETVEMPYYNDDFYGEIDAFANSYLAGEISNPIMSLDASVRCARILDVLRKGLICTDETLARVEKQEGLYQYPSFGSEDALKLGNTIIRLTEEYEGEVAVQIIREEDGLPVFQYVMDSKRQKNIDYMRKKRNCLLKTGHSSVWGYIAMTLGKYTFEELNTEDILASGGAFPIRVNGEHVATVSVSGLHEGMDHELIVRALAECLDKEVFYLDKVVG